VPFSVDQTVFLKTWLKRPMRTGAVVPSSNALARLMLDVNYIDRSATTILAGGSGG
jgi:phospholipid N-methyltransferase